MRSKGGLGLWIRVYVVSSYIIWVQAISLIDSIVYNFELFAQLFIYIVRHLTTHTLVYDLHYALKLCVPPTTRFVAMLFLVQVFVPRQNQVVVVIIDIRVVN